MLYIPLNIKPRISRASDNLSKFESKKAPDLVILPVLLATSPSKTSNAPAQNIKKGTSQANQKKSYKKFNPIKNAAPRENKKPMNERILGVKLCLIRNFTGPSINLSSNSF